jgi:predicted nucleotidyltransferase
MGTPLEQVIRDKRAEILHLAKQHGARKVRIFGSVARGESGPESDVDFLVQMEPERSLFDHVALLDGLEELLGRKVDVVTENSIYWLLRRRILKEARPL